MNNKIFISGIFTLITAIFLFLLGTIFNDYPLTNMIILLVINGIIFLICFFCLFFNIHLYIEEDMLIEIPPIRHYSNESIFLY